MKRISVAVITYNQAAYLREALDSILAQQVAGLEVVVADDGSTDGTGELLREYERRYPGVFVLASGPNLGITGNSNRALEHCTGEYVAWLGGDDMMLPGRLAAQGKWMDEHPECAACFHDTEIFGAASGRFSDDYPLDEFDRNALRTIVRYGFAGHTTAMVRRAWSPRFDERIPVASDWLYWIDLGNRGTLTFERKVLTRYRRHASNATRDFAKLRGDLFRTLEIVERRYPHLRRDVYYARARLWYAQVRDWLPW